MSAALPHVRPTERRDNIRRLLTSQGSNRITSVLPQAKGSDVSQQSPRQNPSVDASCEFAQSPGQVMGAFASHHQTVVFAEQSIRDSMQLVYPCPVCGYHLVAELASYRAHVLQCRQTHGIDPLLPLRVVVRETRSAHRLVRHRVDCHGSSGSRVTSMNGSDRSCTFVFRSPAAVPHSARAGDSGAFAHAALPDIKDDLSCLVRPISCATEVIEVFSGKHAPPPQAAASRGIPSTVIPAVHKPLTAASVAPVSSGCTRELIQDITYFLSLTDTAPEDRYLTLAGTRFTNKDVALFSYIVGTQQVPCAGIDLSEASCVNFESEAVIVKAVFKNRFVSHISLTNCHFSSRFNDKRILASLGHSLHPENLLISELEGSLPATLRAHLERNGRRLREFKLSRHVMSNLQHIEAAERQSTQDFQRLSFDHRNGTKKIAEAEEWERIWLRREAGTAWRSIMGRRRAKEQRGLLQAEREEMMTEERDDRQWFSIARCRLLVDICVDMEDDARRLWQKERDQQRLQDKILERTEVFISKAAEKKRIETHRQQRAECEAHESVARTDLEDQAVQEHSVFSVMCRRGVNYLLWKKQQSDDVKTLERFERSNRQSYEKEEDNIFGAAREKLTVSIKQIHARQAGQREQLSKDESTIRDFCDMLVADWHEYVRKIFMLQAKLLTLRQRAAEREAVRLELLHHQPTVDIEVCATTAGTSHQFVKVNKGFSSDARRAGNSPHGEEPEAQCTDSTVAPTITLEAHCILPIYGAPVNSHAQSMLDFRPFADHTVSVSMPKLWTSQLLAAEAKCKQLFHEERQVILEYLLWVKQHGPDFYWTASWLNVLGDGDDQASSDDENNEGDSGAPHERGSPSPSQDDRRSIRATKLLHCKPSLDPPRPASLSRRGSRRLSVSLTPDTRRNPHSSREASGHFDLHGESHVLPRTWHWPRNARDTSSIGLARFVHPVNVSPRAVSGDSNLPVKTGLQGLPGSIFLPSRDVALQTATTTLPEGSLSARIEHDREAALRLRSAWADPVVVDAIKSEKERVRACRLDVLLDEDGCATADGKEAQHSQVSSHYHGGSIGSHRGSRPEAVSSSQLPGLPAVLDGTELRDPSAPWSVAIPSTTASDHNNSVVDLMITLPSMVSNDAATTASSGATSGEVSVPRRNSKRRQSASDGSTGGLWANKSLTLLMDANQQTALPAEGGRSEDEMPVKDTQRVTPTSSSRPPSSSSASSTSTTTPGGGDSAGPGRSAIKGSTATTMAPPVGKGTSTGWPLNAKVKECLSALLYRFDSPVANGAVRRIRFELALTFTAQNSYGLVSAEKHGFAPARPAGSFDLQVTVGGTLLLAVVPTVFNPSPGPIAVDSSSRVFVEQQQEDFPLLPPLGPVLEPTEAYWHQENIVVPGQDADHESPDASNITTTFDSLELRPNRTLGYAGSTLRVEIVGAQPLQDRMAIKEDLVLSLDISERKTYAVRAVSVHNEFLGVVSKGWLQSSLKATKASPIPGADLNDRGLLTNWFELTIRPQRDALCLGQAVRTFLSRLFYVNFAEGLEEGIRTVRATLTTPFGETQRLESVFNVEALDKPTELRLPHKKVTWRFPPLNIGPTQADQTGLPARIGGQKSDPTPTVVGAAARAKQLQLRQGRFACCQIAPLAELYDEDTDRFGGGYLIVTLGIQPPGASSSPVQMALGGKPPALSSPAPQHQSVRGDGIALVIPSTLLVPVKPDEAMGIELSYVTVEDKVVDGNDDDSQRDRGSESSASDEELTDNAVGVDAKGHAFNAFSKERVVTVDRGYDTSSSSANSSDGEEPNASDDEEQVEQRSTRRAREREERLRHATAGKNVERWVMFEGRHVATLTCGIAVMSTANPANDVLAALSQDDAATTVGVDGTMSADPQRLAFRLAEDDECSILAVQAILRHIAIFHVPPTGGSAPIGATKETAPAKSLSQPASTAIREVHIDLEIGDGEQACHIVDMVTIRAMGSLLSVPEKSAAVEWKEGSIPVRVGQAIDVTFPPGTDRQQQQAPFNLASVLVSFAEGYEEGDFLQIRTDDSDFKVLDSRKSRGKSLGGSASPIGRRPSHAVDGHSQVIAPVAPSAAGQAGSGGLLSSASFKRAPSTVTAKNSLSSVAAKDSSIALSHTTSEAHILPLTTMKEIVFTGGKEPTATITPIATGRRGGQGSEGGGSPRSGASGAQGLLIQFLPERTAGRDAQLSQVSRRQVLSVLRALLYGFHGTSKPDVDLKVIRLTLQEHPCCGGPSVCYLGVNLQLVDDVTEVVLLQPKKRYAQQLRPFPLFPFGEATFRDDDTDYFDGGYIAVQFTSGSSKGDQLSVVLPWQQPPVQHTSSAAPTAGGKSLVPAKPPRAPSAAGSRPGLHAASAATNVTQAPIQATWFGPEHIQMSEDKKSVLFYPESWAHTQAAGLTPTPPTPTAAATTSSNRRRSSLGAMPRGDPVTVALISTTEKDAAMTEIKLQFPAALNATASIDIASYLLNAICYSNHSELKRDVVPKTVAVRIKDVNNPVEGKAKLALDVTPPAFAAFMDKGLVTFGCKLSASADGLPSVSHGAEQQGDAPFVAGAGASDAMTFVVPVARSLCVFSDHVSQFTLTARASNDAPLARRSSIGGFVMPGLSHTNIAVVRRPSSADAFTEASGGVTGFANVPSWSEGVGGASLSGISLQSKDVTQRPDGSVWYREKEAAGAVSWDEIRGRFTWSAPVHASAPAAKAGQAPTAINPTGISRQVVQQVLRSLQATSAFPAASPSGDDTAPDANLQPSVRLLLAIKEEISGTSQPATHNFFVDIRP